MLEGRAEIRFESEIGSVVAGDVLFVSPGIRYQANNGRRACAFLFAHFDFSAGAHQKRLSRLDLAAAIPGKVVREEFSLVQNIYPDYKRKKALSSLRFKGALTLLIGKIFEYFSGRQTQMDSRNRRDFWKIKPALDFVQTHLEGEIRNDSLAKACGMSANYFCGYFKKNVGLTPAKYVEQRKLNRAIELLYEGKWSIQEISERLGFFDAIHFSKVFKRAYRISPAKFLAAPRI